MLLFGRILRTHSHKTIENAHIGSSSFYRLFFMRQRRSSRHAVSAFFLAALSNNKLASSFAPNHSAFHSSTKSYYHSCLAMSNSSNNSGDTTTTKVPDMEEAKQSIARAISIGAPAYNRGDIPECARVYRETALSILPLLPPNLQSKLTTTTQESFGDSNEAAWAFRNQFDAILDYQPPFVPSMIDSKSITLEPFTDTMIPSLPRVVNDNVMGGISRGEWLADSNTFKGTTSLANNGGFASLRWRFERIQNWSYAKGIYLKIQHSDPSVHTFNLILKDGTCERIRLANYKSVFANPNSDKNDPILIPFEAFDTIEQMGQRMSGGPVFNKSQVTELGIMAIKPTVVGEFELQILEWGLYS